MPEFFELEVYFSAGSLLVYQNGLESGKTVDITCETVPYFDFWVSCLTTLIPCHYH